MICSIRNTTKLAAAAMLALGALAGPIGCMHNAPATQPVAELPTDEAMQHRDWSQSSAYYANGSVLAFSNRELIKFPLQTHYLRWTGDTTVFVINAAWMPITLAYIPLFQPVIYHGYQTPPTYTAVPPVQPDSLTAASR
ncbi:MAG TPA: hypothetical protein VHY37_06775 [Tepidisphaeraceae bacterium]|jgi:hypothetical protein|nr:hypothetical protein [Tepidisphaeraceae bacterium]